MHYYYDFVSVFLCSFLSPAVCFFVAFAPRTTQTYSFHSRHSLSARCRFYRVLQLYSAIAFPSRFSCNFPASESSVLDFALCCRAHLFLFLSVHAKSVVCFGLCPLQCNVFCRFCFISHLNVFHSCLCSAYCHCDTMWLLSLRFIPIFSLFVDNSSFCL